MTSKTPLLQSVVRRSLEDRAADSLRDALISRRYQSGERLTEMALSSDLGVSRGTVRSALQRLQADGLVVQRPYASWEVAALTQEDAWELFTLRGALEGLAAEVVTAAVRDGRCDLKPVQQAFDALALLCVQGGSDDAIALADYAFHRAVVEVAKHQRLCVQYERVAQQFKMLIEVSNEEPHSSSRLVAEHQPLLDVLSQGDPVRAGAMFRAHAIDSQYYKSST